MPTSSGPDYTPWWAKPASLSKPPTQMGYVDPLDAFRKGAPTGMQFDPIQRTYISDPSYIDPLEAEQLAASQFARTQAVGAYGQPANTQDMTAQRLRTDMMPSLEALRSIATGGGASGGTTSAARVSSPSMAGLSSSAPALVSYQRPGAMQAPDLSSLPTVARGDASYSPSDLRAAQQAEFGLAKAQAGALGRSGIRGLRSELSGRGILGSGAEIQGTVDQLRSTLQPLSDLNAAHLRESYGAAERERDRAEARADTEFQGGIAQRGQDLSAQGLRASLYEGEANRAAREAEARYQGEIAQRSQNISAQQSLDSLKAALMQSGYQGEITQRGQDLSASAADADRTLSSQRLSVDALSRILSALATSAA